MRTAFEPEGDVRSVDLPAAFASLWRERASGVLRFSRARQTVRLEFLEADVVGTYSSDVSFETAEVLFRAGKLDPTAIAGQRIPEGVDRAAAARQLGLLTERDWRWGEKIRIVEILADLVGWLDGSYELDRTAIPDEPDPGEFRIGIQRLLVELFLRSHDRAFVHHALGAPDAPLHKADDFEESFATLGLTPEAAPVIAAIDGRATAAEISRRMPPDPFSVEKLLAALATLGLVHPEYAAETPPAIKRGRVSVPVAAAPAVRVPTEPPPKAEPPPPPEPEPILPPPPETEEPEEDLRLAGSESRAELPPPRPEPEEAAREPEPEPEPEIELPLEPAPMVSEPEPVVLGWDEAAPDAMDQPLDLPEPPALLRSHRPGLSSVWLLVLLAGGVAALLFFRSAGRTSLPRADTPERIAAVVSPSPAEPPPAFAAEATPLATAAAPTPASVSPLPLAEPTPVPAIPSPSPPRPSPAPTVVAASAPPVPEGVRTPALHAGRAGWIARAREDRRRIEGDPNARYSIQLELVCELPSLEEAWEFDRGGAMWLSNADHRGRACFRVFWGRYATLEEARRAKETVPRFFFTPTNHPVVVATRGVLP